MREDGDLWREVRHDQQHRGRQRLPSQIAEIRRGLPDGFRLEELNDGYALRITGPKDFTLVYYPAHQRAQYRGQWRTLTSTTIVKLLKEVAGD